MAHHGVLFLDELAEFRKNVLEVLRQPLEEGVIQLARATGHVAYPCRVMLIAAMNPCPCGYFNVPDRQCQCDEKRVTEYHHRVSGPLLDRVDITLQTRAVDYRDIASPRAAPLTSAQVRTRVELARARQGLRFAAHPGVYCNAQMTPLMVRRFCIRTKEAEQCLAAAMARFKLSARAHDRILKLARTRADLEGHGEILPVDMQLAIDCRMLDRQNFTGNREERKWARRLQRAQLTQWALSQAQGVAEADPPDSPGEDR
jgi:magnesium chelatase family protein